MCVWLLKLDHKRHCLRSLAPGEASCHLPRTLRNSRERSTGGGTKASRPLLANLESSPLGSGPSSPPQASLVSATPFSALLLSVAKRSVVRTILPLLSADDLFCLPFNIQMAKHRCQLLVYIMGPTFFYKGPGSK